MTNNTAFKLYVQVARKQFTVNKRSISLTELLKFENETWLPYIQCK